jgi:hypothetical protein
MLGKLRAEMLGEMEMAKVERAEVLIFIGDILVMINVLKFILLNCKAVSIWSV